MGSYIRSIEYHLPDKVLSNEMLDFEFPDWNVHEIAKTIGVYKRYISEPEEISSDLAFHAANKLFAQGLVKKNEIDYIIFCTQSNDYLTPTTACILQERLQLSFQMGAVDINQGCTGFIYGLGLAKSLIESGIAKNVLLLTSETISKYINLKDKSTRLLFGDGATATVISATSEGQPTQIGNFIFGTDGKGYSNIIIKYGAARYPLYKLPTTEYTDEHGNVRTERNFYLKGDAVFLFSIKLVPKMVKELLAKENLVLEDIQLFIFHQANKLIVDTIGKKLGIPEEKNFHFLEDCGNTVSSTIPIALYQALKQKKANKGDRILLASFGVGYSWAATIITI